MTAQRLDVSIEEYLADPCPEPSLSSSIASILLDQSAAHAWQAHPKLGGGIARESSAALDMGTLIHRLILGTGAEIEVIRADNFRKKTAQLERDAATARGAVPILARVYDEALGVADAIIKNLEAEGVELTGESEVAVAWQEPGRDGPIWARARFDHVIEERGLIYDVKTSRNAHPRAASRATIDYGYTTQRAAYVRALEALRPELAGRVQWVPLFIELEPPYAVTIGELDGVLREHGERRWARATEMWARCMRTRQWPGYGRVRLEAPGWLAREISG